MANRTCGGCGEAITAGSWLEALGQAWHPAHFLCHRCGKPIADESFGVDERRPMHAACIEDVQVKCALCGCRIEGAYFLDAWGQCHCRVHLGKALQCLGCNGFIGNGGVDGKPSSYLQEWCRRCAAIGVHTTSVLTTLFQEVVDWGEKIGMRGVGKPIPVGFGEDSRFSVTGQKGNGRRAGFTIWQESPKPFSFGGAALAREPVSVSVIRGAPKPLCQTILAHEIGHVWLCRMRVGVVEPWIEEGFCEYLAYRFNGEFPSPLGGYYRRQIAENEDPVYGEGFRRIHPIVRSMTMTEFVDRLKDSRLGAI